MWFSQEPVLDKHVLITGGSSGIGLCLAREFISLGSKVTLVARTQSKLEDAKADLLQGLSTQAVPGRMHIISADVTDFAQMQQAIQSAEAVFGPIDYLVCNAGQSEPGFFLEQDVSTFRRMMDLNYFGALHTIKAALPHMVERRSGHICIVTSFLAIIGIVGYSAYAPAKHALWGLASCLRNELQGSGVTLSVALPSDTQTPGFDEENKTKPIETQIISDAAKAYSPDKVARILVRGMRSGRYILPTPDPLLTLHILVTKGFVPRSFPGVLLEMLLGFLGPPVYMAWAAFADWVVRSHRRKRDKQA